MITSRCRCEVDCTTHVEAEVWMLQYRRNHPATKDHRHANSITNQERIFLAILGPLSIGLV
ncbi:hypothetical protein Pla100_04450 [Neorhodopirellula pilleata]|uniref:Uncharacterized protein n=1 Tax=Neorhodopirellula pilleata TaxID=2714738 RepID=A0A5C6AV92_9BACT|nr:hypothetical protein Pla100_04450 [Neorhodopirellula pilleata]